MRGPLRVDVPKAGREWVPQGLPRHLSDEAQPTLHPERGTIVQPTQNVPGVSFGVLADAHGHKIGVAAN
jgi:hypothetical protein